MAILLVSKGETKNECGAESIEGSCKIINFFFFSQFEDERIMDIFLVEYFVSINYF